MCTKPDCDVLITYRPAYAAAAITCKCSELDSSQRERFGCEAARRVQAAGALAADPLILYRESSGVPGVATRLSEIPEEHRELFSRAVGEIRTCISCRFCEVPAGMRAPHYDCRHPRSVGLVDGLPLYCHSMRSGACGSAGGLWEPISEGVQRLA